MFTNVTNLSTTSTVVVAQRHIAIGKTIAIPTKDYQKWYAKGGKRLVEGGIVGEGATSIQAAASPPATPAVSGEGASVGSTGGQPPVVPEGGTGGQEDGGAGDGEEVPPGTEPGDEGGKEAAAGKAKKAGKK